MSSIVSFTTGRRDGNARHRATLRRLLQRRGAPPALATGQQVHGTRIAIVPPLRQAREYPQTDGLLTAVAGQPLGIFTADCVPIFLTSPSQGVIGLLHAGWRGVRGGILLKAIQLMRRRWSCKPKNIYVWVGPCIGPCCFEVRWDVARYFPATRRRRGDRWVVDLGKEIQLQARRLGASFLTHPAACTHHPTRYHSFRRDATKERQISVILRRF